MLVAVVGGGVMVVWRWMLAEVVGEGCWWKWWARVDGSVAMDVGGSDGRGLMAETVGEGCWWKWWAMEAKGNEADITPPRADRNGVPFASREIDGAVC
jgi:hypothetical protein